MSQISILVPLNEDTKAFEDTLASILCHQPSDSELIVVHTGEYHDPYDLEIEGVKFLESESGEHWTQTMLRATERMLDSQIIHTVMPGVQVDEGWCDEALEAFCDPQIGMACPVLVSESEPDFVVSVGVGCSKSFRRNLVGKDLDVSELNRKRRSLENEVVGPSVWCGFYRREVLQAFWHSRWPLVEQVWDLDFGLSCQKLDLKTHVMLDSFASVFDDCGFEDTYQFRHGEIAQALLCRHGSDDRNRRSSAIIRDMFEGLFSLRSIKHALDRFLYRPDFSPADISERWERLAELTSRRPSAEVPARRAA